MMSRRVRTAKASAISAMSSSISRKTSIPIRKTSHSTVQKKTSMKKSSSTIVQPRQKRLSSLTARTLLQYCSSILSPSRKLTRSMPTNRKVTTESKERKPSSVETKDHSRKRQNSNVSNKSDRKPPQDESNTSTRVRREASSRASAMIMQQNEIERSRYNYSLAQKSSSSTIRRNPTKTTNPVEENVSVVPPPPPSIILIPTQTTQEPLASIPIQNSTHASSTTNKKYPQLTEAVLAEHNRIYEASPSRQDIKHDNLLKWKQELDLYGRLSPPYSEHELSSDSCNNKSTASCITNSKTIDSTSSHKFSHSFEHLPATTKMTTSTFLFPSTAYPLDLHSFYPILPCWQYPTWPYPSTVNAKLPAINPEVHKRKLAILNIKPKQEELSSTSSSNNDALTFHLHTHHHHHHIHNPNSLSLDKTVTSTHKAQHLENDKTLKLNNSNRKSSSNQDNVLNLSTNIQTNLNQSNDAVKKTTRRKSSPTKRRVNSGTKSNSSLNRPAVVDSLDLNNDLITAISKQQISTCASKRRSASAATTNSITTISITNHSSRKKRTHSASNISPPSKSPADRKRQISPTSISLTNRNLNQRKKQKVSSYWILSGKSEQHLVQIHPDKPPVFRECYLSIQHITEKDIINSNDCIILRSETGAHNNNTPYVAKVKYFWHEPEIDEIQMSLIWYYHPEHTDLSVRAKERLLSNELLASRYADCVSVECIEDKCYVLNLNEYSRYTLREKSVNPFEHSEPVGQLKMLLNQNNSTVEHRPLPPATVGSQNIFFCRFVYDHRANRILKNPSLNHLNAHPVTATTTCTSSSSS